MSETFPVYDQSGQRLAEQGGIKVVKFPKAGGESGYTTAAYSVSAGNDYADAYKPIRAETSAQSGASLRYSISNIPIPWKLDSEGGVHDFYVVAISSDGEIVEDVSSVYLSYDNASSTLTIQPLFGSKDFCVYVFRDEQAINLFAIKADGNANISTSFARGSRFITSW